MVDIPTLGTKVRVWPAPGRKVQNGPRPVDRMGGGKWLEDGVEVVWSEFHFEQYRAGDLFLHSPYPAEEQTKESPKAETKKSFFAKDEV